MRDVATLSGGFSATGSVVFKLFSDPACSNQVFSINGGQTNTAGTKTGQCAGL